MLNGSQTRTGICETCYSALLPGKTCGYCDNNQPGKSFQSDVLRLGTILGRKYKLGRLLSRGGFGATYLAWDLNLAVRIAIKEFLPRQLVSREPGKTAVLAYPGSESAFEAGLHQFLAEARNLAQFRNYPGIISVLDFFPENGTGYMVMEYLDGSTVEQYVSSTGQIDLPLALRLLIPVADALRACHAVNLIHRDVSPDNIFLTSDHQVKLLDFGAARFAVGQRSTNLSVILKEGYAPFEQYQRNGRQGPWTDIYALSATLYRLLTGELPTTAPDRIAGALLSRLADKGVHVPARVQALLDKGMALQPERRYQTVDDFLNDLQAAFGPGALPDPSPPVLVTPRNGRTTFIIATVGALGLVGIVGGLVLLGSYRPPASSAQQEVHPSRPVEQTGGASDVPGQVQQPQQRTSAPPVQLDAHQSRLAEESGHAADVTVPAQQPQQSQPQQADALIPMRDYVRQVIRTQIRLRNETVRARRASISLQKLSAITNKTEAAERLIRTEKSLYDLALDEQEAELDRYVSQVEWLSRHDDTSVDTAIKLERTAIAIAGADTIDAPSRSEAGHAIDLLARHVRLQRQTQLTRDTILASLNT
jgi:serine/threonine protein kinase